VRHENGLRSGGTANKKISLAGQGIQENREKKGDDKGKKKYGIW